MTLNAGSEHIAEDAVPRPEDNTRKESLASGILDNEGIGDALCCLAEVSLDGLDPGCFVATASLHDKHEHPDLLTLRAVRDRVLLKSRPGRLFVYHYYRWGPIAARAIRGRKLPCWLVRKIFVHPMAGLARRLGKLP